MYATTSDDALWKALASAHRRRMLDSLRDGPRTTNELAAELPELSRFAVMQHLEVLVDAGLVVARRSGRHRFNHLNTVPLHDAYERWVGRFASESAQMLTALRRHVEEGQDMDTVTEQRRARRVQIESEILVAAPRERVFAALADEQSQWYPHSYGGARVRAIVTEPFVGGRMYEDWGDGAGVVYGTITYWDPPKVISTRGYLRGGTNLEHWWVFEEVEGGTLLKHTMTAFGDLSDDDVAGIRRHGDLSKYADQLRAWVERGERATGSPVG